MIYISTAFEKLIVNQGEDLPANTGFNLQFSKENNQLIRNAAENLNRSMFAASAESAEVVFDNGTTLSGLLEKQDDGNFILMKLSGSSSTEQNYPQLSANSKLIAVNIDEVNILTPPETKSNPEAARQSTLGNTPENTPENTPKHTPETYEEALKEMTPGSIVYVSLEGSRLPECMRVFPSGSDITLTSLSNGNNQSYFVDGNQLFKKTNRLANLIASRIASRNSGIEISNIAITTGQNIPLGSVDLRKSSF